MSRPAVHPVEPPPLIDGRNDVAPPRRVRMKDVEGMPGTSTGLALRLCQFVFTVISLTVMATTSDFPSVTAFRYLVAAITSTLTFAAACACAGITVLISNDLDRCDINHCKKFMSATALAFLSWFAVSPSFFLNFWSLASQ
ncbi:Uncharacterized protein family UPF0497, trans-membrane plant [Cynara cardunculus var. scolymus]|uniref:CASP-like protein n=1 Tax=Cynara cardunculus var. scolymus TaxID=59895 RepID=A0A103XND3_CYNCS|nr:Uncharacterized protein family UPF0497, trans-membrane plant [Cynara cardunculus var. scolymus]